MAVISGHEDGHASARQAAGNAAQTSPPRGRSANGSSRRRRPLSARPTIVPVRVCNAHGDYFDTEIDQHRPLRALQHAIEDYFHVKSELQLITHNRQQVDPELSLYNNGCILLKGDPYIKLVFTVKRGLLLNVICQLSAEEAIPLAAHEMGTVYAVKQQLCEELVRRLQREEEEQEERQSSAAHRSSRTNNTSPSRQRSRLRSFAAYCAQPQRVRLLWRYVELNDKATLHYYHIPTNAVLHVRWRRGPLPTSTAAAAQGHLPHELSARVVRPRSASRHDDRRFLALRPLVYDVRESNNNNTVLRPATAAAPVRHPRTPNNVVDDNDDEGDVDHVGQNAWTGYVPVAGYGAVMMPQPSSRNDIHEVQTPPSSHALHSALRPTSSRSSPRSNAPAVAAAPVHYIDEGHAMAPVSSTSASSQPPQHQYGNSYYRPTTASRPVTPTSIHPLTSQQQQQRLEEREVALSGMDVQGRAEVLALRDTVRVLQSQIDALRLQQAREQGRSEVQTSMRADRTAHRIEELEATVERFHGFLQRALSLLS